MSLRDQLSKAGLVKKKHAQRAEAEERKREHAAKKSKDVARELEQERLREQAEILSEQERKKERDRLLNLEREAVRLAKETKLRCVQLLRSNQLNENSAHEVYFFVENNRVRRVSITPFQREMLARGKYGIARVEEDVDEFVIIVRHTAETVRQLCPEKLLVLHSVIDDSVELLE